jgi:hypothetical protein
MYTSFVFEMTKLGEESFKEKAKTFLKVMTPAVVGVGVGSALADQLAHTLETNIDNNKLRTAAKAGLIIGAPIMTSLVIPQVRQEWDKLLRKAHGKDGPTV